MSATAGPGQTLEHNKIITEVNLFC